MTHSAVAALKELDHAKYLACLFAPEKQREAFAALNGYAAELRRIPSLVSEPLAGEIRLQWWRDIVSGARAGEANGNINAVILNQIIGTYHLPIAALDTMAEARIFDLYNDPMPDLAALETYLGETEAAPIQLGALILDPDNAKHAAEAAGHAGMAIGIANILRNLPRTASRQRMFVPATILQAVGVSVEQIFAGDQAARAKTILAFAALGREHLKSFKRFGGTITPQLRPAFLGVSLCEPIFRKIEKAGAKAFETEIPLSPLITPLRLAYRAMRGW